MSVAEGWRKFACISVPNNISLDLKLIIELAYFAGAQTAYDCRDEDDTEAEIGIGLIGVAGALEYEQARFLKSQEEKGQL